MSRLAVLAVCVSILMIGCKNGRVTSEADIPVRIEDSIAVEPELVLKDSMGHTIAEDTLILQDSIKRTDSLRQLQLDNILNEKFRIDITDTTKKKN